MPEWVEQIDHTGDVGLIVRADSLTALYERSALAMFSEVITDIDSVRPQEKFSVTIHADDREALMVKWLSELNFRHITAEELFCRFDITRLEKTRLEATVYGEPIDPDRHEIFTEIKAVTFHELRIFHENDQYTARIIFDL